MKRDLWQFSYADRDGQFHYFQRGSRAGCLRLANKYVKKRQVAHVLIRRFSSPEPTKPRVD